MIIITIGLSIVIQEAALHIWDEKVRSLPYFTGNEMSSVRFLGAAISPQVLWVLGTVALVVLALHVFLRYTLQGRAMRACSSNPEAAMLAGINIPNMRTLSFGLSAALGALAGCVISPITMTHYEMGGPLAIKGFAAAILGGLGQSHGRGRRRTARGRAGGLQREPPAGGLQRRRRVRHSAAGAFRAAARTVRRSSRGQRQGALSVDWLHELPELHRYKVLARRSQNSCTSCYPCNPCNLVTCDPVTVRGSN